MKKLQIPADIKLSAKSLYDAIMTHFRPILNTVAILVKYSWRLAKTLVVLIIIAITVMIFCEKSRHHVLSPKYNIYRYDMLNRYRIKDVQNDRWISGYLTSVDTNFGRDSLLRFSKKNILGKKERYGYLDVRTYSFAIKPQFSAAGVFSEGLASASNGEERGFIDTNGKFVIKLSEELADMDEMVLIDGHTIAKLFNPGGQTGYGIINTKGEWVLEPIYEKIERSTQNRYIVSTEFREGLWSAEKGWIVEPKCINIEPYNCDKGFCILCEDKQYIIDADGKITNPFVFNISDILPYNEAGKDNEVLIASDYMLFGIDHNCVGVYNISTNRVIIPAKYTRIHMIAKDVFVVEDNLDVEYLVDKNGNVIKPVNVNVN